MGGGIYYTPVRVSDCEVYLVDGRFLDGGDVEFFGVEFTEEVLLGIV